MTAPLNLAPGLISAFSAPAPKGLSVADNARAAAQDFEAMFLNSMLQQVFAGVGEGPFSGGYAAGVWRSFLTDEYAKLFARNGGIGIADHVQRFLLEQQEAAAARSAQGATP